MGKQLPDWKRGVIKIGSALIAPEGRGCSSKHMLALARFITESIHQGKELIIVSSGAVAAGLATQTQMKPKLHRSIIEKQALAAIGQSLLMAQWARFFDFPCAQILLTHDDIHNRRRFVNAKNTIKELLKLQTLPIINENDSVAVEELKVGDNDNLAAHVAVLAEADLLMIFSDIRGLYDSDPRSNPDANLIDEVFLINEDIHELAGGAGTSVGTGGMRTKIQAAEKACAAGIDTLILSGKQGENMERLLAGELVGTIFHRTSTPLVAKKHWLRHALPCMGRLGVDNGAVRALQTRGASLLPSGVISVSGEFRRGDAVEIGYDQDGTWVPLARGITQYNSDDLQRIKGLQSADIEPTLGYSYTVHIIHRSDLILYEET